MEIFRLFGEFLRFEFFLTFYCFFGVYGNIWEFLGVLRSFWFFFKEGLGGLRTFLGVFEKILEEFCKNLEVLKN